MDNDGNFREQSEACMMKAVSKGELSVKDFYEKKADIAASVRFYRFPLYHSSADFRPLIISMVQNLYPSFLGGFMFSYR